MCYHNSPCPFLEWQLNLTSRLGAVSPLQKKKKTKNPTAGREHFKFEENNKKITSASYDNHHASQGEYHPTSTHAEMNQQLVAPQYP